jgi:HSP20 family protein
MGTLFLERHFSPLDILVKNFFNAEQEEFQQPNNRIINHPVDIYEDKTGLYFDIACTGLTKKQIELKVEDDVLRVIYTKKDDKEEKDLHHYHSGIAKRSFNIGWKIARRFSLPEIEASMKDGLLKLFIPLTPESKAKTISIK